nr:RecX family transcriptional regulator [Nocardia tengchongensis]
MVRAELPPSPAPRREASPAASPSPGGATSAAARRESPSDDAESAAELVRAKLRTLSPNLDREATTRRLVGLLARRGYPSAIAYNVVTTQLNAANFVADTRDRADETPVGAASSQPRRSQLASSTAAEVDDEHTRATELVRSKLRTLPRNLDHTKATQRLVGLLARRGFSASTAYAVVKAELSDAARGID